MRPDALSTGLSFFYRLDGFTSTSILAGRTCFQIERQQDFHNTAVIEEQPARS